MKIIDKIHAVDPISRQLDPAFEQLQELRKKVIEYADHFLQNLPAAPANEPPTEAHRKLLDFRIEEEGKTIDQLLISLKQSVDNQGINPASGGYLAYIPGGGIYPSALGDYLAAVFNKYAGAFFANPGAVRIENMVIRWMCEKVGYPASALGNLTSGGSIANQIALCTARDSKNIKARDYEKLVIYSTQQVHHCLKKAIYTIGLREATWRTIPTNENFCMDVETLEKAVQEDIEAGKIPFAAIASAGTTSTGAVDPIDAIASICAQHDIWLHVDAAYGGFFILCDETKALFKGIEQADSIVMDPHKGLFLPYGTGTVLIKEGYKLFNSQKMQAEDIAYMQDARKEWEEYSPADLSPELTKHFRGLRLWMPLQLFGEKAFRAALSEKLWLCRYFYEKLESMDGFEVGPKPMLSVMLFRYIPKTGNVEEFNQRLVKAIQNEGKVYLSPTTIDGVFYIRLAVLSFRTHLEWIDLCLERLQHFAKKLEANQAITK